MTRKVEKVEFVGSSGARLAARLDRAAGEPRAYALFAHCFTCSKDVAAATHISISLAEQGVATLRFDFTGLGSSEGEFANTDFSSNVDDLEAAAGFLRERYRAPALLLGHSLGGTAVLAVARRVPEALAVVTVAAPADPEHVRALLAPALPELEERGEARVSIAGRSFRIRKQFLDDIAEQRVLETLDGLDKALLVFHSPQDRTVGIDNARRIFEAARHPKSFVSLDGADHLLDDRRDSRYVGLVLAAWASRYLDSEPGVGELLPAAREGRPDPLEAGIVRVQESGSGKFTQLVRAGRHRFLADEPEDHGGDDAGPSPYELLSAGLGACTGMTLRMYANRKGWPLDGVVVDLEHDKIHARDCEDCETREGKLDRIERTVYLRGDLDEAQRDRLLEIADRCPVHRTLHSEVRVVTRLGSGLEDE